MHQSRREDQFHPRIAARDDGLHVTPGGANRARDHAHATRRGRERALALLREETLGDQAPLQRLETQERIARARGTNVVDPQLAAALAVIELDPAVREDLRPVARRQGDLRGLRGEQHALQLADVVAKGEVDVTRRRDARLRDLALDPQILELVTRLDVLGQPHRELADAQDVLRRARDTHPSACRP